MHQQIQLHKDVVLYLSKTSNVAETLSPSDIRKVKEFLKKENALRKLCVSYDFGYDCPNPLETDYNRRSRMRNRIRYHK